MHLSSPSYLLHDQSRGWKGRGVISRTEFKNMWIYTFTLPKSSRRFFMKNRKYCRLPLMTKSGVHFSVCSSTRWQCVQTCTTSALSIRKQLQVPLLKISWVDARARLIAVWKKDFLTVWVMEFSDRPAFTIWAINTVINLH